MATSRLRTNETTTAGRTGRRLAGALLGTMATLAAGLVAAPSADAVPYGAHYVKTLRCDTPNPIPGAPLRTLVDVYTGGPFPSDGIAGPSITLSANNTNGGGMVEITSMTTVRWRNTTTGRKGVVRVPRRGHGTDWEVVLHPGKGRVSFTIGQKVGAMVFVPMVNPQYSTCRGSARL